MSDRRISLRRTWFQVHKWIGIVAAIVLIPLSFTGALLVWDEPLDHLLHAKRYAVTGGGATLPMTAFLDAARTRLAPGAKIMSLSTGKGEPVVITALDSRPGGGRRTDGPPPRSSVWLDPATGAVLDSGPAVSGMLRWVHGFHGNLQIPGVGRAIVGWFGVAMLLSSLTGLWLWWPTSGAFMRGLRWRRQPAVDGNLHHLVGFWMCLPLAILSLTGAMISFPVLAGGRGGPRQRPPMAQPLASPHLGIDVVIAAANLHGRHITVTWPTERAPAWRVSAGRDRAVEVADQTGTVTTAAPAGGQGPRPLYRRLHDGTGMGIVWQGIIFLAGIAPAILGTTGIIMWLRTRRWRGKVARRASRVTAGG